MAEAQAKEAAQALPGRWHWPTAARSAHSDPSPPGLCLVSLGSGPNGRWAHLEEAQVSGETSVLPSPRLLQWQAFQSCACVLCPGSHTVAVLAPTGLQRSSSLSLAPERCPQRLCDHVRVQDGMTVGACVCGGDVWGTGGSACIGTNTY